MRSTLRNSLLAAFTIAFALPGFYAAQTPAAAPSILTRHYQEGETLSFHMKATNKDRLHTTAYEIDADGVVKKNAAGNFTEEYAWTNLVVNGKPAALSPAIKDFRQTLSLDPAVPSGLPNLRQVIQIVGPITDLLTFYADLWLSTRLNKFAKPDEHFYFYKISF
jgi:hypothetical protein